MKLEHQVCSHAQATRLKELGVSQNSICVWTDFGMYTKHFLHYAKNCDDKPTIGQYPNDAAAFTSAELGMLLPSEVRTEREPGLEYSIWVCSDEMNYEVAFPADTEAQAKAEMLIFLISKGYNRCGRGE